MERLVLELTYMVFWLTMFFTHYPYVQRTKLEPQLKVEKKWYDKMTLGLAFLGMLLLPVLYLVTTWFDFADYQLPMFHGILGILLLSPSSCLFYKVYKDLAKESKFDLELPNRNILVTKSVYAKIRHPMYTAIWLWVFAQALLLQNYIVGLAGVASFGLLYFSKVQREEKYLEQRFKNRY